MKLNYCLECAAPLNKKTDTLYVCDNGHEYWNNPSATVAVVLMKGTQILVSKRANEPNKGKYDLPGGFLEYGEPALHGVVREIAEETGLILNESDLQIIGAYSGFYLENESLTDIIILAKDWHGEPVAADDSAALLWKPLDFLDSDEFDPDYQGLRETLEAQL